MQQSIIDDESQYHGLSKAELYEVLLRKGYNLPAATSTMANVIWLT